MTYHSIREFKPTDVEKIREIHERFYKTEFDFPDFMKRFICAYVVEDQNGDIICAGGVRNLAEVVLITDKEHSTKTRRSALYQVLDASAFIAGRFGHDSIHAFCMDDKWTKHLTKVGFRPTAGHPLFLGL